MRVGRSIDRLPAFAAAPLPPARRDTAGCYDNLSSFSC